MSCSPYKLSPPLLRGWVGKAGGIILLGLVTNSLAMAQSGLAQPPISPGQTELIAPLELPSAPRLFVDPEKLNAIRQAIAVSGSHHHRAFASIKARVDRNDWRIYDENPQDGNWNYARSWLAREAAFVYLITGEQSYAQIAFDALYAIHQAIDPEGRLPESSYGLSRAATGMGFALAYDWAASGWTPAQREYVVGRILDALDAWPSYRHGTLRAPYASNWVAVCRGAELVMILAVGAEVQRSERFNALKFWLREHIQTAYGETGLTSEGQGYLAYAGGFLMPAIYALRSVGDPSLESVLRQVNFEWLLLYGGVFNAEQSSLQFGVGGGGFDPEGLSSFLLDYVDAELQPYYQYFYDHYRGLENPAGDRQKFDHRRAGTVWSVLYYPIDRAGLNPTGVLPRAIQDPDRGSYLFRNRWQDADDILIALMGDFIHHRRSWDQPETFSLGVFGYGTRFFGGPGKTRDHQHYSKLLVNGQVGHRADPGAADFFAVRPGGGYAIVDGGSAYRELGLVEAKRHLLVNFSADVQGGLMAVLDQLVAVEQHIYTWQANLGTAIDDGGIRVTSAQEAGVTTFLLRGGDDSYLKGWILNPTEGVSLNLGDPLQLEMTATNADIWVVMVIGTGPPAIAQIRGTGMNSQLYLGSTVIYFDQIHGRIVAFNRR